MSGRADHLRERPVGQRQDDRDGRARGPSRSTASTTCRCSSSPQFLDLCAKVDAAHREDRAGPRRPGGGLPARACPRSSESCARKRGDVTVIFLECADHAAGEPLPRDPSRASALAGRLGRGRDRERSAAARGGGAPRRPRPGHDDPQRPPAPRPRDPECGRGGAADGGEPVSFGFRYGPPPGAELLFDVRFLPNPHFEPELRPRTGEDDRGRRATSSRIERGRVADGAAARFLLDFLLPLLRRGGQGVPDDRGRLHGRASSLGGGRERAGDDAARAGAR